jgi:hypothetical protein
MEWWVRHSIEHLKNIVPRNQKEGGLTLGLDTDSQKRVLRTSRSGEVVLLIATSAGGTRVWWQWH